MSLMKKLKLYDGEEVEGFNAEGRPGAAGGGGARGHGRHLAPLRHQPALDRAGQGQRHLHQPDRRLRALRDGFEQHTEHHARGARAAPEPDRRGAQASTTRSPSTRSRRPSSTPSRSRPRRCFNNYLDNVEAFCNKTKLRDPITEEEVEPDEKLMRSIEEQIGVTENAKKAFREEILIRLSLARRGKPFDYRSHERLREAIEKKLFADLKDVVKITTSTKTPDAEQLRGSTTWSTGWSRSTATAPSAPTSC